MMRKNKSKNLKDKTQKLLEEFLIKKASIQVKKYKKIIQRIEKYSKDQKNLKGITNYPPKYKNKII